MTAPWVVVEGGLVQYDSGDVHVFDLDNLEDPEVGWMEWVLPMMEAIPDEQIGYDKRRVARCYIAAIDDDAKEHGATPDDYPVLYVTAKQIIARGGADE